MKENIKECKMNVSNLVAGIEVHKVNLEIRGLSLQTKWGVIKLQETIDHIQEIVSIQEGLIDLGEVREEAQEEKDL